MTIPSTRGRRRPARFAVLAAAAVIAAVCTQDAAASSASSTLGMSVTVVRSCSVAAQGLDGTSAAVKVACSSGHVSSVRVGSELTRDLPTRSGAVHVIETQETAERTPDARLVTLNF